jgi:hypothetical protein
MSELKTDVLTFAVRSTPGATAGTVKVYGKTFNAVASLAAQSSDGIEHQLTPVTPANGSVANNKLDSALTTGSGATVPNSVGPHSIFPAGRNTLTLVAGQMYRMRGQIITESLTFSYGPCIVSIGFAGTATYTRFFWQAFTQQSSAVLTLAQLYRRLGLTASAQAVTASTSSTNRNIRLEGNFVCNAAGTFIPQISFDTAPGSTITIHKASFIELVPQGTSSFTQQGGWA